MYQNCTLEELIALSDAIHQTLMIAEPQVHRWFELPMWYDDLQIERACLDERIRFLKTTTRRDPDDTQPMPVVHTGV